MKNKRDCACLMTIKDLYDWAVEQGIEEYILFKFDVDGTVNNCFTFDIEVDEDEKALIL